MRQVYVAKKRKAGHARMHRPPGDGTEEELLKPERKRTALSCTRQPSFSVKA